MDGWIGMTSWYHNITFFFQVANPVVRANAAALLVDAFPLQSSELSRADSDA